MKYQIEKTAADIGVKVVFGSIEGVDNIGGNPDWEAKHKVRLENLQKHFDGLDTHSNKVTASLRLHNGAGMRMQWHACL